MNHGAVGHERRARDRVSGQTDVLAQAHARRHVLRRGGGDSEELLRCRACRNVVRATPIRPRFRAWGSPEELRYTVAEGLRYTIYLIEGRRRVADVESIYGYASDELGKQHPQSRFAIEEVHTDNPTVNREQRADLAVNRTARLDAAIDEARVLIEKRLHGGGRRRGLEPARYRSNVSPDF
jgi:hypothetical protein